MGMTRAEIRRKLDAMVSFAGIERFLDLPVKRYSSGMYARLGFSIAAHVDPDVLLVDVVASEVDGLPDTVRHGVTGLLTPPQAPEQLADAIITLLEDPARRRQMGLAGREMVERSYDWQTILDKWVSVYERARDRAHVMA